MCPRGVGNCVGGAEIVVVVVGKVWELGEGSPARQPLTCRAEGCSRLDSGFCTPGTWVFLPAMPTPKKEM